MMKLTALRKQRGVPITVLLHEAVSAYYSLLVETAPSEKVNEPESR